MNLQIAKAWERVSLRVKLTALSVAVIGILVIISSFGTVALLRTYLQNNTDDILTNTAATLRTEDPALVQVRLANQDLVLPRLPSDYYIAYLDAEGTRLLGIAASTNADIKLKTPNLDKFTLDAVLRTHGIPFDVDGEGNTVDLIDDGDGWRMLAVPLTSVPGSFVIALPTNSDTALIQQYRTIGKSFGALLLLLSAMGIWITITSALRPLKEVERTAAAVSAGDISQRLIHREGKTEVARINRALNSMLDSIEGAFGEREATLEQMRRFVADASHELRTPLASVRGYAELYRMGALSDKKDLADAMGRIESEAVRMGELVESLLVLARIDENKELTKSLTNLTKVVEDAAKNVSVASPKSKLEVVSLDGKKPSEIEALIDADSIRQVVINLISNATNFSPANKKITIAVGIDAGKKVIEVRDRGEGIPAQLREKIFERFYRVDNSRNRETGGSGLGLAICKSIVDRHHGSIKALETEGGGATLRVELP